ncbi:hypothetical protein Dimus_003845 [Dionaea muscipula]
MMMMVIVAQPELLRQILEEQGLDSAIEGIRSRVMEGATETEWTVAILDGITMGVGAGVSIHGMFCVVIDKTSTKMILEELNSKMQDEQPATPPDKDAYSVGLQATYAGEEPKQPDKLSFGHPSVALGSATMN